MDWATIVASIAGSGGLVAGLGLLAKRALEGILDVHVKRMVEENRALIQEEVRRSARVFDTQYDSLRAGLTIVYRLRNTIREAAESTANKDEIQRLLRVANKYNDALEELLFVERATLPEEVFEKIHKVKRITQTFLGALEEQTADERMTVYKKIDLEYSSLADDVRAALGVD